ncbi:uncharacterized protein LOC132306175 [Cornus florida]|uniref:uncharacterized protein LOC132306175 n=1 Tax=Cornus florida TaxID=4283 RepID=UPI00289D5426|nr:uncharacterized protein LOC132306175 [Cornus florida]
MELVMKIVKGSRTERRRRSEGKSNWKNEKVANCYSSGTEFVGVELEEGREKKLLQLSNIGFLYKRPGFMTNYQQVHGLVCLMKADVKKILETKYKVAWNGMSVEDKAPFYEQKKLRDLDYFKKRGGLAVNKKKKKKVKYKVKSG